MPARYVKFFPERATTAAQSASSMSRCSRSTLTSMGRFEAVIGVSGSFGGVIGRRAIRP